MTNKKDLNQQYWNNRYNNDDAPWDIGSASIPLQTYIDQLKNKDIKILIPGGGHGYEAAYLYQKGFKHTYLLDLSKKAFDNFKLHNPNFPTSNLILGDFFEHNDTYDLIFEQTFFCAIDPVLRQKYATHVHKLLKKGGKLVGLLFDDLLNKDTPPFGGTKEEYLSYFKDLFKIKVFEHAHNSIKPRSGREFFFIFEKNH